MCVCVLIHSDDRVDLCLVVAAVTFILNCHLNRLFSVMQFPVILRALFLSLLSFVFVLPFHLISVCAEKRISIFDLLRHSTCYTGECVCVCLCLCSRFSLCSTKCHTMRLRDFGQFISIFSSLCFFLCAQPSVFTQSVIYLAIILPTIFFSLRVEWQMLCWIVGWRVDVKRKKNVHDDEQITKLWP